MTEKERAIEAFSTGHNCAQSVLLALSEHVGLDGNVALRMASAFGGGMGRLGEACGAATGAFMAIGYAHGPAEDKDPAKKEKTYALVREFAARFIAANGALNCRGLTGLNLASPEGQRAFAEKNFHSGLCSSCVGSAVQIAIGILQEK